VTLVLTTHYMDEAEQLCDRLVIMDRGEDRGGGLAARADPAALVAGGGQLRFGGGAPALEPGVFDGHVSRVGRPARTRDRVRAMV
jgi:energy-coupling factor transporter ATP-binding protein EcfA2